MRDPPLKLPYAIWRKKAVPIEHGTACSGDPDRAALGVVVEREHELYDGRRQQDADERVLELLEHELPD